MHALIVGIYGMSIWLIVLVYLTFTEPDFVIWWIFLAPFVVSGSMIALLVVVIYLGRGA